MVIVKEQKCSARQEKCVHQCGILAKIRENNNHAPPLANSWQKNRGYCTNPHKNYHFVRGSTEKKLCFTIGDVSWKGVPAALFMMITKTLLKTVTLTHLPQFAFKFDKYGGNFSE